MQKLIQVALTGGIASGKTTAAALFARQGAAVIDTDVLAHRALEPGTRTYAAVLETFGSGVVKADGTVNRARLGEIVFADAKQRERLNEIVHPAVRAGWLGAIEDLRKQGWRGVAMVVIPLLYEIDAARMFDGVVTVACSEDTQRRRLSDRGLDEGQAQARMQAQLPMTVKMDRADFVIWNESPMPVLQEQVVRVWQRVGSLAGDR